MMNSVQNLSTPIDPAVLGGVDLEERAARHEETARKFEEVIATMLVKEMRQALPNGFFGGGIGSDTFEGWLDKNLGESLASNWDLDLAGMIKAGLDTKQAAQDGGPAPEVSA